MDTDKLPLKCNTPVGLFHAIPFRPFPFFVEGNGYYMDEKVLAPISEISSSL